MTVGLAASWWWGLVTGTGGVAYDELASNFAGGLAALLAFATLNVAPPFVDNSRLLAHLLAFVGLGLFALALSSIQEARRFESARVDHDLPLAHHWWSTVAAVVAALLVAALLISWLLAPASLDRLAAGAAALLHLAGQLVVWLIMVVSYPNFWLLAWLGSLLQVERLPLAPPPEAVGTSLGSYSVALAVQRAGLSLSPCCKQPWASWAPPPLLP